ncbi:hypothetical protein GGR54DRAFT_104158 [Hypoxylon sp. NC1633]|nr:hypothetical protein GGR54DRAFT_104158 [Hypoxylon sp. NC1633]
MLETRLWEIINSPFSDQIWSMSEAHILKTLIRQMFQFLVPSPQDSHTLDQLAIWHTFTRCPILVSDDQLSQIIPIKHHLLCSPFEAPALPSNFGTVFYVVSWSLPVGDLDRLSRILRENGKTFEELKAWKRVAFHEKLSPSHNLTIRYVGSCSPADWPWVPLAKKKRYDDCPKEFAGVLAEFLPIVEFTLPQVADSANIFVLPSTRTRLKAGSFLTAQFSRCMYKAFLAYFGYATLINRYEDQLPASWDNEPFEELHTSFNKRASGSSSRPFLFQPLQKLFHDLGDYCLGGHKHSTTGPTPEHVASIRSQCSFLERQATPVLFQRRKALMVFVGMSMCVNDYICRRPFLDVKSHAGPTVMRTIERIAEIERSTLCDPGYFPYYCFAPFPRRKGFSRSCDRLTRYLGEVRPMI